MSLTFNKNIIKWLYAKINVNKGGYALYTEIIKTIYDSNFRKNWQAIVTLQQIIALADNKEVIGITAQTIAERTGIPLDIIRFGIETLEASLLDGSIWNDPWFRSRTPKAKLTFIYLTSSIASFCYNDQYYLKHINQLRKGIKKDAKI